ncbi:hypothetical protein OG2516_03555 [Oceanicola granulosus HTCC2516]|uniref:Cytoskeleton protein RodZ-like C-terminal domain-containing protein n=2 Tax=Oceanicola granulosus TaxID=252302 RepID=Q2CGA0_OCEGH|nr:helix-turn-helix domain-containing protein [Oceanicola granulosus]EAR51629.1 hypothetical protein OG2516_03555 [Oceanicola granulosus HTCC2516]
MRLGDMMRGERATLGKSLLDVQRELKIKAAYIAAIENADPSAFETPGFIAGYVRSYARYLGMDPEWAFDTFCRESGFETMHGMSSAASTAKAVREERMKPKGDVDMFATPRTPFVPSGEAMFSRIEPGAVGSVVVLLALIGGLGYGGYSVLNEVQKVQFAPVEQAPTVMADLDPLAGGNAPRSGEGATLAAGLAAPASGGAAYDRLYRPQALDVPVMVARDAPISTLNPHASGALTVDVDTNDPGARPFYAGAGAAGSPVENTDAVEQAVAEALGAGAESAGPGMLEVAGQSPDALIDGTVQVTEDPLPAVQLVAARDAWVRVTGPDGSVLFETIMEHGDTYTVPQTEEPATLRIGESGAVYFAVNGNHYGPVGPNGAVTSNVALSSEALLERYQVADINADSDLSEIVRVADAGAAAAPLEQPAAE